MPDTGLTILDGGMGRELLRIGAPFRQPEWSALALLEAPEFVSRVHESYVAAGARVITSNSYALVPYHLGEERFTARAGELADLAGRLGRAAADRGGVRLAGSLPPACGSYRPDLFREDEAARILAPLVAGLSPHVDLWLAETQGGIREGRAAKAAIDEYAAAKAAVDAHAGGTGDPRPFWLSFTLDDEDPQAVADGRRPPVLRSGESVTAAARAARDLGARALLFNCSHAGVMAAAVREAAAAFADLPPEQRPQIGVYANAFAPLPAGQKDEANETVSTLRDDLDPPDYLAFARQWQDAGASIIGGCCGIGPEHIAALTRALAPVGK